jgi:alpha-amylase
VQVTEYNGVMMQYFHWYAPADGSLWRRLAEEAEALAAVGVTSVWLPPAYKGAAGGLDTGYGVYDLFDLGEFDQKGSVRTKYGTRDEYLAAIRTAQAAGIRVYADIVLNHKMGGDHEEEFLATPFDPADRNRPIGELQTIKAWTHFAFPGRAGAHSTLQWHWWHFNASDANMLADGEDAVYLFEGKRFHDEVDLEKGNYDFLMGCNIDVDDPDVRRELYHWGEWYLDTTGVDGFRFDAVKHVGAGFFAEWLDHLRAYTGRELFAVGEYWSSVGAALRHFLGATDGSMMLFDTVLHYSFARASREREGYDLRTLFDGSLVAEHPDLAVTIVSNHDTQPLQSLESVVEPWFVPLAYAAILLRRGGYPCVFYADYYGASYAEEGPDGTSHGVEMASHGWMIDRFLEARRSHAYGEQREYFDDPDCVGWARTGTHDHPGGLAVVLANAGDAEKWMQVAPDTTYVDISDHIGERVTTDGDGWGAFRCQGQSVSVWLPE